MLLDRKIVGWFHVPKNLRWNNGWIKGVWLSKSRTKHIDGNIVQRNAKKAESKARSLLFPFWACLRPLVVSFQRRTDLGLTRLGNDIENSFIIATAFTKTVAFLGAPILTMQTSNHAWLKRKSGQTGKHAFDCLYIRNLMVYCDTRNFISKTPAYCSVNSE